MARNSEKNNGKGNARLVGAIRGLSISNPSRDQAAVNSDLKANIILVSKFAFTGESSNELSIAKGDILKLLDRPGNGWLLVKFIDKLESPGLIPASYVDIAINDSMNPVTLDWLYENNNSRELTRFNDTNYLELQVRNLMKTNAPITINNKPYPIGVSISNFLLFSERYWYRLDVVYSDQSKSYVCRYYQDFYNLHLALLELVNKTDEQESQGDAFKLPKLPEPIPSNLERGKSSSILFKRCKDLNVYINKLIQNENFQCSKRFISWLDCEYKDLPGFTVGKNEVFNLGNDDINEKVQPGSINILRKETTKTKSITETSAPETPVTPTDTEPDSKDSIMSPSQIDPLRRSKSKNIYNHYKQVDMSDKYERRSVSSSSKNDRIDSLNNYQLRTPVSSPSLTNNNSSFNGGYPWNVAPSLAGMGEGGNFNSYMKGKPLQVNTNFRTSGSPNSYAQRRSPGSTPTEPSIYLDSPVVASNKGTVKCKIVNFNEEIIALRLDKSQICGIPEFKRLIRNKIFYSKLYIKLPNLRNYENIDNINFNLVEFLKFNDKVLLRIN